MLNNEQINNIIEKCNSKGYNAKVRDVAYVVLCETFEDSAVAYKCLFGDNGSVSEYESDSLIVELRKIFNKETKSHDDITFEENKAYMLKLKKETEDAIANKEIDKKDGLKILADISTKLNDKFSISEEVKDQIVQVCTKFNSVCASCGRELYIPTKEDLMKKYNLKEA